MYMLHCLKLVYSKNYFNLTKIFVLRLFKMVTNQTGSNRGLLSNFWSLKSTNHKKFTEECEMCMEKHVLIKKMFANGPNMDLPQQA